MSVQDQPFLQITHAISIKIWGRKGVDNINLRFVYGLSKIEYHLTHKLVKVYNSTFIYCIVFLQLFEIFSQLIIIFRRKMKITQ